MATKKINYQIIAESSGYNTHEVQVLHETVAKGTNETELAYFLSVAKSIGLNPFIKEIWCYKNSQGDLVVFAGRDGFLAKAQQSDSWNGIASCEVCKKDAFERNIATGQINHPVGLEPRGKIVGAYAIVRPKGVEITTIEYVELSVYDKKEGSWLTHTADMIKKVAETKALKKAYGISGIQSEYEFQVKDGIAKPIVHEEKDELDEKADELMTLLDLSDKPEGEIEAIRNEAVEANEKGKFTIEFINGLIKKLK